RFAKEASQIARQRADLFLEQFLNAITSENPQLINRFNEPAIQSAVFVAQKSFAKTGDNDLFELLIKVLSQRLNAEKRTLDEIILDESLSTLPKLTKPHIELLTFLFVTRHIVIENNS